MATIAKSPAKGNHKPSASTEIKKIFKRSKTNKSLKVFVSELTDEEHKELASNWLHNKKVNTSKPQLGLGSTRKKKGNK